MIIKILGPGCTNCKNLERATREALEQLHLDATVEKVQDYPSILGYGVMSTPGLVVDDKGEDFFASVTKPMAMTISTRPGLKS